MFHPLPSSDPSPGRLLWCQQIQETDAGNLALTVETLSSRHLHALCEGRVQLHRLAKFSAEIVPQHALLSTGCNVKLFKYIYIVLQVHGKALFRNPAKAAEWQEGFLPQLPWQYCHERHLQLFLLWSQRRITETSCVLGVWENLQTRFGFVCTHDLASCQKGISVWLRL